MKRITAFLLTLIILAGALQFNAFAADGDSLTYGSFTYTVTDGEAAITKLDQGVTGSVIIPPSINGVPVTAIASKAFEGCSLVTGLTMPSSITSVRNSTLSGLTNLESFYYTGTLIQWCSLGIGSGNSPFSLTDNVFINGRPVDRIRSYDWNGLKEINIYSFYGCKTLTAVEFPDSLEKIGVDAFSGCTGLTVVEFPDSLKKIESGAFSGCTGISRLFINAGINAIDKQAFIGCTGLESITVSEDNETYFSSGNCLINRAKKELVLGCKNSVIPSDGSVTVIGEAAFRNCAGLKKIDIPEGVISILNGTSLKYTAPKMIYGAFSGCPDLEEVTFPSTLEQIGTGAFYNCPKLERVNLNNNLKTIGNAAFMDCTSITEITIPENITTIGKYSLSNCTSLTALNYNAKNATLSSGLTAPNILKPDKYIDWLAGCSSLINLVFGDKVEVIPNQAFYNINTVETITIWNTVQSIGEKSFEKCNKFSRIYFHGTPDEWIENYNSYFTSTAYVHDIYYLGGLCTKTDDASNVTVQYLYGTFGTPNDSELTLNVEDIEENDARFSAFKAYIDGSQVALYEIHMKNADDENVQPLDENKVTVKIPLPYAIDPAKYDTVFIHHRKQDGKTERIKFSTGDLAIEDGFFIFEIDSFSDFAVCVDDGGNHVDEDGDYICDLCKESLTYTVKLIVDGNNLGDIVYHYGDTEIKNLPEVPEKAGYTGDWDYTITGSELDIKPVYTPVTYYASFIADGSEIAEIPFTVEDKTIAAPAVPAKEGYIGKWSEYTLAASDITVNADYELITYYATFSADGREVARLPFTIENKSVAEPQVPAKEGFTGRWSEYTLEDKDITVNAVYTKIDEPENPVNPATPDTPAPSTQTEPEKPDTPEKAPRISIKNYRSTLPVYFKSKLVFHLVSDSPVTDDYKVVWSTGEEGATCTINQAVEKEYKISAKLVRVSDGSTAAVTKEETVTVNTGFFARIIAFFKEIFKALPVYEDNIKK